MLLVPVDFSPASRAAAEYAASLAKQLNAGVQLLHVYAEPMPVMEADVPVVAMAIEIGKELRLRVKKEAKELAEKYNVSVKGEAVAGLKGDTIKAMAEELKADLICLGRKAKKHQPLVGSTILKAVRKAAAPVLVVPENAVYRTPKNIVLAVDFKKSLRGDCLTPLFQLVKAVDASVNVLHVDQTAAGLLPDEVPAKLQLDRVLSRITYHYEPVESGDVENAILKFIDAHAADLLVMTPHRHGLFARLFGELHATPLAFEINIPLLLLKNEP